MAQAMRAPAQRQQQQQSQESSLVRRQKGALNPIMEEDSDDARSPRVAYGYQKQRGNASHLKIHAWLSPMSDHFPTPRGNHFLSAPIVPASPSTVGTDDTSPTNFSNPWNRASIGTENTEFEDLYDVSEDEDEISKPVKGMSAARKLMPLVIPTNSIMSADIHSARDDFKKLTSPVPITPSLQLTMSPALMNFMDRQQALEVPTISAPPSLDGSLTSEQLAAMSAPPTPVIGNDDITTDEIWGGVHLQPGALATLHALSSGEETLHEQPAQVIEFPEEDYLRQATPEMRQQPLRLVTDFSSARTIQERILSSTAQRQSLTDLSKLDIPSPGGFFSGLSPRSRTTWHVPAFSPAELAPPTSTTAEQFYRCPWNSDANVPAVPKLANNPEAFYSSFRSNPSPVEQVVMVPEHDISDDVLTARPVLEQKDSSSSTETVKPPKSPVVEEVATEIVVDVDPLYARKQQQETLSNLDRTSTWLLAQQAYLKGIMSGPEENNEAEGALTTIEEASEEEESASSAATPASAQGNSPELSKMVRFSNIITTTATPKRLPSKLMRQESAYYRAFQEYVVRTQQRDVFVHQLARFEALQAQRVSLRDAHRNQLLGKYQLSVVPQSAKKRLSTNVVRGDDNLTDDPEKLRKEKEFEAMTQVTMATWHVAAMKFLNGGRLITAPVTKRLARLSHVRSANGSGTRERARILDLGGQTTCDWAWHCALQYPNAKVYTVTTKAVRQLSNSNIRGPPNHRQVAVQKLTKLPFADDQFDLISARELHSLLKFVGGNGEDEWESCLKECMRVLKPGGYLEFSLLDSDIMNAGPLGLAKSVEFGFALKTLGYDPNPSKLWMGRLSRAGFEDTRRAWLCLPLGARRNANRLPTPPASLDGKVGQLDTMVMGSSENIAGVCSMVGGWSWEKWLLRCEMEKVAGELRLQDTVTAGVAMKEAGKCLEGVAAVMEEGRACKSGFRMLTGYARKPKNGTEFISIGLDN